MGNKSKYSKIYVDNKDQSVNPNMEFHMTVEQYYDLLHHTHDVSDISGYSESEIEVKQEIEDLNTHIDDLNRIIDSQTEIIKAQNETISAVQNNISLLNTWVSQALYVSETKDGD